jgi:hypothetical protein
LASVESTVTRASSTAEWRGSLRSMSSRRRLVSDDQLVTVKRAS